MSEIGTFDGFGPDAMTFLDTLARDNTTSTMAANRRIYDEQVVAPLRSLVVELGTLLADRIDPGIRAEARVGRSMFRINRDLRFGKDKTPYNPYLDVVFWHGDSPRQSPGLILRIRPDEVLVGAGVPKLRAAALDRYRHAIAGDPGAELELAVAHLEEEAPALTISDPSRKRVPTGFDADHPRSRWLRRDGFHASSAVPTPASITTREFAPWCAQRYEPFGPVLAWLVVHTCS